jgi:hypothetical protein
MIFKSSKITELLHKSKSEKGSSTAIEELPRPDKVPDLVAKYLASQIKMDPDLVPLLMSVTRKSSRGAKVFDIRVFDEPETLIERIAVKNYNSLNDHPELIIFEGWFDRDSKQVEGKAMRAITTTPIFTGAEILKQIEALTEPGSTVSFFLSRGPNLGGPLGRGAFIVELNPNYPSKGKKYNCYSVNVLNMELAPKGQKLWDSNKPKDIANWVRDCHHKRTF